MSSRLQHVLAAAWILMITAAVLAPALARGPMIGTYDLLRSSGLSSEAGVALHGSYASSDLIVTNIPWTILNWTQVHHGILPLWNPYNGLGLPLAFDWQSASFGLPSLVGYLLPLRLAATGGVIVTLLVAGTGAYALGRTLRLGLAGSLMVATVFELSGPLIAWLGYPLAGVMSWGGWLFAAGLLVLREGHRASSVAVFAVVTAFAIYAGHPETLVAMEIALLVFLLAMLASRALPRFGCGSGPIRRPAFDLVIGTAAGCALGGPLLLPALQLTAKSVRAASNATPSLPVHDLLYTVFSAFDGMTVFGNFGFDQSFFYNETAAYVGSIAVALALIGVVVAVRNRRAEFLALGVVVIVMGALVWTPAVHLIEQVPNIGDVAWTRALMPLSLGLAALAGMGMDAVTKSVRMPATRKWFAGVFGGATVLMALLWLFGRNGGLPNSPYSFRIALFHVRTESFLWPAVGLAVGLAGALLVLWRPATGRLVAGLLLGFESIFLVTSGAVQIGSSTQGIVDTPAVNALKASVGNAVVGFGTGGRECALGVTPEVNIALQLHEIELYDPIVPKSYFATWSQISGSNGQNAYNLFCPSIQTVTEAQDLGVEYVLESAGNPGPPGSVFVKSIRVPNPDPANPLAKAPPDEDLYRIPDAAPVTLTAVSRGRTSGGVAAPLRVNDSNPAHWSVTSNASTAGVLRIHLTSVPGWSATIDGRPLALERSSVFLLQAKIPPGRHVITLNYWPSTFTGGIAAAIAAVLFLIGWIVIDERRKSRTQLGA